MAFIIIISNRSWTLRFQNQSPLSSIGSNLVKSNIRFTITITIADNVRNIIYFHLWLHENVSLFYISSFRNILCTSESAIKSRTVRCTWISCDMSISITKRTMAQKGTSFLHFVSPCARSLRIQRMFFSSHRSRQQRNRNMRINK